MVRVLELGCKLGSGGQGFSIMVGMDLGFTASAARFFHENNVDSLLL